MPPSGSRRFIRSASLVLGIAVIGLGALEILLRLILGLGTPVLFVANPQFGYFPKGDQHIYRFFSHINTNRFGMRSMEVADAKQAGEFRILFVGDSVAYGPTFVDQPDLFVSRIQRALAENGRKNISVLNGSAPGWAPSNELGFIRSQGVHEADVVVMVYNTKDLNQPFSPYVESPLTPLKPPPTAIAELWTRYIKPRIFKQAPLVDPGSTSAEGRPDPRAMTAVLQTIAETKDFVESKGARFLILFTPAVTADVRQNKGDWDAARTNLQNWANDKAVPMLDMTPAFSSNDAKQIYFDGIHLRPAGDAIVAETFIAALGSQLGIALPN